jgi:hypothetical protein
MGPTYWKLPAIALPDLTPARARDLVVDCFYFAHHETFERAKRRLGARPPDEDSLRATVIGAVRMAFRESGGDFDRPTVASLAGAIAVLGRKAESWGTPPDIVRHHGDQIRRLLERMERGG